MPLHMTIGQDDLDRLMAGTHWDPHSILGPHAVTIDGSPCLVIRAYFPDVKEAELTSDSTLWRMTRVH
jgi:1,4-alpha-glucan branching enzyme